MLIKVILIKNFNFYKKLKLLIYWSCLFIFILNYDLEIKILIYKS